MPKENEDSIPYYQYKHTLSKSSSSGSTRADSFEEREKQRADLSERLHNAEEDARKLEKEKEKLEHKLKEAKMAAANVAETEVNRTCIWIDTSIYTCTCIDLAIYPCWIVYTLYMYMYMQYFYLHVNVTQFLIQTDLTVRLSVAEEDAHKLKKENEKLERKLKEAEMVAAQADMAGTEVHVHVHSTYRHIHVHCTCI